MTEQAYPHRRMITLSVMLASIMQALDNTIANVALPDIQGSLSTTQDQITWVLTSYIIAAAIMTPLSGWLAGRVGRRRVFLVSIVGFTVASSLCGLAQTLPEIVAARLLQGIAGAALIPMSQAALLDINPPHNHARAMALWVMGVVLGPIIGPVLGGWLTENYDWRWVFYINVPFGVLAFFGVATYMRETPTRRTAFDFFGFATLSLAIGALQLMLDRGQLKDWFGSTEIRVEAGVALLALYLFVVHMLTTSKHPFISPALFKDRNFLTGNFFIFVVGVVLFATLALLPSLMQDLLGYPVVLTGLLTAPRGIGTLTAMFIVGRIMGRIDTRLIIGAGFAITAYSAWQMTGFYLQMDSGLVLWSGLAQGLGTGFVYVPLATITFATLPTALRNEGTAMFSLIRNVGSSIGISFVETMLVRGGQTMHAQLAERATPYGAGLNGMAALLHGALPRLNAMVEQQAMMIAYDSDFRLMMLLSLAALPLIVLLRAPRSHAAAAPSGGEPDGDDGHAALHGVLE